MTPYDLLYTRIDDEYKQANNHYDLFHTNRSTATRYWNNLVDARRNRKYPKDNILDSIRHLFTDVEFQTIINASAKRAALDESIDMDLHVFDRPLITLYYGRLNDVIGEMTSKAINRYLRTNEVDSSTIKNVTPNILKNYQRQKLPNIDALIFTSDLFSKEEMAELMYAANRDLSEQKSKRSDNAHLIENANISTICYAISKRNRKTAKQQRDVAHKDTIARVLHAESTWSDF